MNHNQIILHRHDVRGWHIALTLRLYTLVRLLIHTSWIFHLFLQYLVLISRVFINGIMSKLHERPTQRFSMNTSYIEKVHRGIGLLNSSLCCSLVSKFIGFLFPLLRPFVRRQVYPEYFLHYFLYSFEPLVIFLVSFLSQGFKCLDGLFDDMVMGKPYNGETTWITIWSRSSQKLQLSLQPRLCPSFSKKNFVNKSQPRKSLLV